MPVGVFAGAEEEDEGSAGEDWLPKVMTATPPKERAQATIFATLGRSPSSTEESMKTKAEEDW